MTKPKPRENMWTEEQKLELAGYIRAGLSSGVIAEKFPGRTRSAICGLAKRMGLCLKGEKFGNTMRKGKKRRPRAKSNVIPMKPRPKPKPIKPEYKAPAPVAPRKFEAPKLTVVSNNVDLLKADWLARNGGPRRFERGESGDYWSVRAFLEERGYSLNGHQAKHKVSKGGQSRLLVWRDVVAIADQIREAEGRPTLMARAHG